MNIWKNISGRNSVANRLVIALLSAALFLFHETGASQPAIYQEPTYVGAVSASNQLNAPDLVDFQFSKKHSFLGFDLHLQNLHFQVLSRNLTNQVALTLHLSAQHLPIFPLKSTEHFQSRSLISEGPSFS